MKKNNILLVVIVFILLIALGGILGSRNSKKSYDDYGNEQHFYVNVKDVINDLYCSKNGYNADMKASVYEPVFHKVNIYALYKEAGYKDDIDAEVTFTEINQHRSGSKVFVYMKYDSVVNFNGEAIASESEKPVVFTVNASGGTVYIEDAEEYETDQDVPEEYR